MKRLWRILRSPRTAVWLLVALGAYSAIATAVPQRTDAMKYAAWSSSNAAIARVASVIGLDRAFSSIWFVCLCMALCLSAIACSLQRTVQARRKLDERGHVTDAVLARLRRAPHAVIDVELPPELAIREVRTRLSRPGVRVRAGAKVGYVETSPLGLFGSPVFHWALVGLIAVISLGQLTRWEGLIGIPEGQTAIDRPSSYGTIGGGFAPLPHTGWAIKLVSVDENKKADGVDYGWTPTISMTDGRGRTVTQQVHANKPLSLGPLLIHYADKGLTATIEVIDPKGSVLATSSEIVDFDASTASGTTTVTAEMGFGDRTTEVDYSLLARNRLGDLPQLRPPRPKAIFLVHSGEGESTPTTLAPGQSLTLPNGYRLRLVDIGYYARLSVVRDWSVVWIYGLMGLASLAMTLTLVSPFRSAWFEVEPTGDGSRISLIVNDARRHPAFALFVREAIEGLAQGEERPA